MLLVLSYLMALSKLLNRTTAVHISNDIETTRPPQLSDICRRRLRIRVTSNPAGRLCTITSMGSLFDEV